MCEVEIMLKCKCWNIDIYKPLKPLKSNKLALCSQYQNCMLIQHYFDFLFPLGIVILSACNFPAGTAKK